MDREGIDASLQDVERILTATFAPAQHTRVRERVARLEHAPMVSGDAARLKVAALLVADGDWDGLVDAVELGLADWRDLLVNAFYADQM